MREKKYFRLLLFSFALFNVNVGIIAQEEPLPITIVGPDSNPPFSFILPNGEPAGLYVGFWQLWSRTNNIPINIQLSNLGDSLDKVAKNGAVHVGLFINESREEWADFSAPIHHVETGFLCNSQCPENTRLVDSVGLRVGIQTDTFQADYLVNNMPNLDLVFYSGIDAGIDKLLNNELDALVAEIPLIKTQIAGRGLGGVFPLSVEVILNNTVHAMLGKGQTELLHTIDEGIKKIPIESLIELELKWLPTLNPFFGEIPSIGNLTIQERDWLRKHKTFSLGVETSWYPFEFLDEKDEFQGIASDYVEYAGQNLGVTFQAIRGITWSDAFEKLKSGHIDIMSGVVYNTERAKLMDFTDPYFAIPGVIVIRQNSFYLESLSDLSNKKAGIVRGYILIDSVSNDFPDINIVEVDSVADGLARVKSGEIDAYIGAIAVVNYEINKLQLTGLTIAASTPYRFELAMAVRKGLDPLVSILNKTFDGMSERQKSTIANNWLSVHVQAGTDIKVILLWVFPILSILSILVLIILIYVRINRKLTKEIFQREEAEKERRTLERQLSQSQKMEALGKLTGGIAHDFNNMLGIITGYSELLLIEKTEKTEHSRYAEEILRAGKRGAKLTSKLLAYSSKQVLESAASNLNTLLKRQQDMLQKILTVRINLCLDFQNDLWFVWLDEGEMEDALINLCINAMHAMEKTKSGAQLTIRTCNISLVGNEAELLGLNSGDYVQLVVTDNGCGMEKSVKDRIFDPFFSTKSKQGSGLGLSQTYGFVKRSNGAIQVHSEPNRGAQFILFFPRYEIDEKKKPNQISSQDLNGHETILVVDDEPALRNLAAEFLRRKGYVIHQAENGIEALKILETEKIDLLFSDVIMPKMDGYELAAIVEDKYPSVKIQLASGFAKESIPENLSKHLWNNMIDKPFNSNLLCEKIRNLLDE